MNQKQFWKELENDGMITRAMMITYSRCYKCGNHVDSDKMRADFADEMGLLMSQIPETGRLPMCKKCINEDE